MDHGTFLFLYWILPDGTSVGMLEATYESAFEINSKRTLLKKCMTKFMKNFLEIS